MQLRLHRALCGLESVVAHHASNRTAHTVNIVRFEETINGRSYVIEVLPVGRNRWRAHIARRPGATTALMPFYGETPDAAARQLAVWLDRAAKTPNGA